MYRPESGYQPEQLVHTQDLKCAILAHFSEQELASSEVVGKLVNLPGNNGALDMLLMYDPSDGASDVVISEALYKDDNPEAEWIGTIEKCCSFFADGHVEYKVDFRGKHFTPMSFARKEQVLSEDDFIAYADWEFTQRLTDEVVDYFLDTLATSR